MSRSRPIAWFMLAVWSSWLSAAQGLIVTKTLLGPWTPDLGVLLLVACAGRLHKRDVPLATVVVAFGRLAHTVESPAAVLAGFVAASVACQYVRRLAEVGLPLLRTVLAAIGALGLGLWFALVHALRTGEDPTAALAGAALPSVATALSTGLVGLFFLGSLVHLPGLSPLRDRRW